MKRKTQDNLALLAGVAIGFTGVIATHKLKRFLRRFKRVHKDL